MLILSAVSTANTIGDMVKTDTQCDEMRRKIAKFFADGDCGHLSDVRNQVDSCTLGLGIELESVLDVNKAGVVSSGGLAAWDKLVDSCYENARCGKSICKIE